MYYHVTPPRNTQSILRHGLRARGGRIYCFTRRVVANTIAADQVFARRYSLFRILRQGMTGPLGSDRCAEFSAPFQRVLSQPLVEPQHLLYLGEYDAWMPGPWEYRLGEMMGLSRHGVQAQYAAAREGRPCCFAELRERFPAA
jgi:hypothetical protein